MTKILNLDKLAPKETRELQLGGKTYQVREMSVEDFIETSRMADALANETNFEKQMEASFKLIKRSIPDIDMALLRGLNLEQLAAVSKFARGEEVITDDDPIAGTGERGKE